MSGNNNGNGKPPEQPHRPLGAQGDVNVKPSTGEVNAKRDGSASVSNQIRHPSSNVSANPTGQTLPPPGEMQAQRVRNASACGPRLRHNQVTARVDGNCAAPGQPNFLYNPMGAQVNENAGQFGQPFLPFNPMSAQLGGNPVPSGQPILPYTPMCVWLDGNAAPPGHPFFPIAPMSAELNANTGAFGPPFSPNDLMSAQFGANVGASGQPFLPFVIMTAQENGNNAPFAQPNPSSGNLLTEHQNCVVMEHNKTSPPQEMFQLEKMYAELAFENAELRKECSKFQLLVERLDHAYQQTKLELECIKEKQRRNNYRKVEYLKERNQTQDNHEAKTRSPKSQNKEDDKMMEISNLRMMLETMREHNSKLSWQLATSRSHINLLQQRLGENSVHIANELQEGEKTLKLLLDKLKKHEQMIEGQENFLQQRATELNDQELKNEKLDWKIMYLQKDIRQKNEIIKNYEKKIQQLQEENKYVSFLSAATSEEEVIDAMIKLSFPITPSEEGAVGGAPAAPSELPVTEEKTSDEKPQENRNKYPYKLNIRHQDWI